jgi:hypothetical protein
MYEERIKGKSFFFLIKHQRKTAWVNGDLAPFILDLGTICR